MAALLGQHLAGMVTIFLPNNGAYHNSYFSVFDAIFPNESLVNKVALYHVVDSFLDYNTLLCLYPSSLATVSGQACNCLSQFKEISSSSATLMPLHGFKHLLHRSYNQPNLYLAPGEIAVHGIKQSSFSSWHHVLELRGTSSLP